MVEDARSRLQTAALELFRERGYERTTAAEISARAGVTERTFYRYFPDKREVLFDSEAMVLATLTSSIADAPASLGPIDTLFRAFRSFQPMLEGNRSYAQPRHSVISVTPALRERELSKIASLSDALATALQARGSAYTQAVLAANIGMVAFVHVTTSWLEDPGVGLEQRFDSAFSEMKELFAESK